MLGLVIAIPFGPIRLVCVQRTLALGIWFGIASGMGAAVAHALFSFLAAASAAALAQTAHGGGAAAHCGRARPHLHGPQNLPRPQHLVMYVH